MTAYYNEINPTAAQWLRNLIAGGHIAPGVVDERSIEDVIPDELREFTQCHFFAGVGVWSHALRLAGWPDNKPVWTGSCPCQPFSQAGKGAGFDDERHLWPAFFHLISECRPGVVFGEQVASKDGLAWIDLVQTDLEATGHASGAVDLCAAGLGAPHIRQRLYWVGDSDGQRRKGQRLQPLQGQIILKLPGQAKFASWPTPTASNVKTAIKDPNKIIARMEKGRQPNLQDFAALASWPTPTATDHKGGYLGGGYGMGSCIPGDWMLRPRLQAPTG